MRVEDIIEEALVDRWIDKITNMTFTQMPQYEIKNNILHIYTPIKPYKILVLRRLLKIFNIDFENIIIGYPYL